MIGSGELDELIEADGISGVTSNVAYQIYQEIMASERFRRLAAQGAQPQRLLWASTSTKNAAYQDTKYVEELIGPETINTLPPETLKAYRDHGQPRVRLTDDLASAQAALRQLGEAGIQLPAVAQQLEDEGAAKFNESYDALLATLEERRLELCCEPASAGWPAFGRRFELRGGELTRVPGKTGV